MNQIKIFFSMHQKQIKYTILTVIIIIVILKTIDYIYGIALDNKNLDVATNTVSGTLASEGQKEAVTGIFRNDETFKKQTKIIEDFLNKCNTKNYEEAYALLSDDCKQALYPSINLFIDGYYNNKFARKQTYSYQLWLDNTYQIKLRNDILTSGIYNETIYVEDYYTVVGDKLNIGGLVKRKSVNEENKYESNIIINIENIDYYRNYATCTIKVTNNSENEILLDPGESGYDTLLQDRNGINYTSFTSEMNEDDLKISKGETKEIQIKFNVVYNNNIEISKVIFSNIILNYNNSQNNENEKKGTIISIR